MINSEMIKDRARAKGVRQRELAAALGLQQSSLNLKINNRRPMMLEEAERIASMLDISDDEFRAYFFAT